MRRISVLLLGAMLLCFPLQAKAGVAFDKAIKIGSGKTVMIEYTDPDCPYCRKASAYLRDRRDVTRYIFLNPLPMHPHAKEKAQYILSSRDKAKAYEEVMAGKLDGKTLEGITKEGAKLQEEHAAAAREAKANSTPTFVVCGRIITGFDQQKLQAVLGGQ